MQGVTLRLSLERSSSGGKKTPQRVTSLLSFFLTCFDILLAQELWDEIDRLNQSLAKTLLLLSELYEKDKENYTDAVKYISSLQSVQVRVLKAIDFLSEPNDLE